MFDQNGKIATMDYKYAEYKGNVAKTWLYQAAFYALMIEDKYKKPVEKGYICYTRSNNKIVEIQIKEETKKKALEYTKKIREIVEKGIFPDVRVNKNKCIDCTYKNVCPQ